MPCPASGTISIQDLVDEFGGTAPHSMSEYYRDAGLVPGNNTSVPTSGAFSLTDCYSAVNEIQHTHSDGDTHVDLSSVFGSNWASTVPKRVIIPSGVTVGGTTTHAINVPTGMGGTLVFDISGNVLGYGGAANSGVGGNAIYCAQTSGVTINLNSGGTIKGGGGGGGQGGTGGRGGNGGNGGNGGQGRQSQYLGYIINEVDCRYNSATQRRNHCRSGYQWHTAHPTTSYAHCGGEWGSGYYFQSFRLNCYRYNYYSGGSGGAGGNSGGAGGAGGAGGRGEGYNQTAQNGSGGSGGSGGNLGAYGGSGSNGAGNGGRGGRRGTGGTGGTGGAGGSYGNQGATGSTGNTGASGSTGSSGTNGNYTNGSGGAGGSSGVGGSSGSAGGLAGYYIYNRASITFNNSGTVAGR